LQKNILLTKPNSTNYRGYWFRGFFKVPTTGIYNFIATVDDSALIYFSPTPGSTNLTQQILINQICSWQQWRDQYSNPNTCSTVRSQDLNLTAGNYHYVEAYWYQGVGSGYFTVISTNISIDMNICKLQPSHWQSTPSKS
jgi:hypothetical protein